MENQHTEGPNVSHQQIINWSLFRSKVIDQKFRRHETIDNQGDGLETQAKSLMLLTPHPWYGLIRFTLEPCNFTLNISQDFLFTYSKQERQCQGNYRLLKLFWKITKLKTNAQSSVAFWLQKYRDCWVKTIFIKTFNVDFWPCLPQSKFEKSLVEFTFLFLFKICR